MKSGKRQTYSWDKTTFAIMAILFLGIALSAIGLGIKNDKVVSIGCSLIASSISGFIMGKTQDASIDEVTSELQSIESKINTLKSTNNRIVHGVHLKDTMDSILEGYVKSDRELEIDILGLELFNFWEDNKRRLRQCKRIHLRMIVQDPDSLFFDAMLMNEGYNKDTVKLNIHDVIRSVKEWSKSSDDNQIIEIRKIAFPASVTLTRINGEVFVRARLIEQYHEADDSFFERYVKEDLPYRTFGIYFDKAWRTSNSC